MYTRTVSIAQQLGYEVAEQHTKKCLLPEVEFSTIAAVHGIGPVVLDRELLPCGKYKLTTKGGGVPLLSAEKPIVYIESIVELLHKLHNLGILHGDLSEENIVIDEEGRVRLIDYGYSRWLKEIDIPKYREETDLHVSSIEDICAAEIEEAWRIVRDVSCKGTLMYEAQKLHQLYA